MIKICDSIMGSGKTQSAITYINEHLNERFIYITPYLAEADRIRQSCLAAHFRKPSNKIPESGFSKVEHTAVLIAEGANIATTHQCFKLYTREMLNEIKEKGYTLLLDESLSIFEKFEYKERDLQLLIEAGVMERRGDVYVLTEAGYSYDGDLLKDVVRLAKCRELIDIEGETADENGQSCLHYWSLPLSFITSFKDVIVMTYLFHGQTMQQYLRMNRVPYTYIGVCKEEDGTYRFSDKATKLPAHVKQIKEHLHILDNDKMNNNFGRNIWTTGSMSWFENHPEEVEQLRKNIANFFRHYCHDIDSSKFMWATYAKDKNKLKGKGYTKGFVSHNARASNDYRDRTRLAYACNPFMNCGEKIYFRNNGIRVDEDAFALSMLIQWVWRSAIRDGQDVYLYLPMSRMRRVLTRWLDSLDKEVE